MFRRPVDSRSGFTLIELLIGIAVVVVIGGAIAAAIWAFSGAGTGAARQTTTGTFSQADTGTTHFIKNGGSQTFVYTVTKRRSDGQPILPTGVTMNFAVTGGLTVAPPTATTDDTGLISVVVTAPATGQGSGQLTATPAGGTSGPGDTIGIEFGP
jgi:prepilin-type N-terminal cleavage/methylation domain-containing protein